MKYVFAIFVLISAGFLFMRFNPGQVENRYLGICDGSAAIRLDKETLLVAYDEINTLFAFDISGGRAVAEKSISGLLGISDVEIDIEAAVISQNLIWWVGSHGHNKKGGEAPNRRMLFATNLPNRTLTDLKVTVAPIDLLDILVKSSVTAAYFSKKVLGRKPKEGGVNIEGLVVSPDGQLMIGFRSPLNDTNGLTGKALIVYMDFAQGDFGISAVSATELDLGDRGIRDIVRHGNTYFILAGAVPSGGTPALYQWDGAGSLRHMAVDGIETLNPEALVRLDDSWLILSDDGKQKRLDDDAKDGDRICDKIRKKNPLHASHENVYFRGVILSDYSVSTLP